MGHLEVNEYDEAGCHVGTYVQSSIDGGRESKSVSRVDYVAPKNVKSSWQMLLDVFLPAGYPQSVTDDYLPYQIYDSLQAFSSSIAHMLASRAVLEGVGVGDANASPTAALLLSVLQESLGRLATILFAHRLGTSLEPECKMYRLLADVLNDVGTVLDCLSPAFPKPVRVAVLAAAGVLRALCGVAAGSAKASLSAHFAKWGNLGELNAKDSSQETIISLLGMLAGSLVVSVVSSPLATWTTLIALLGVHLGTNRAAVRAVRMRSLNRQRANIALSHLLDGSTTDDDRAALSPAAVADQERIFERDGVLRWFASPKPGRVLGHAVIGARMGALVHCVAASAAAGREGGHATTTSTGATRFGTGDGVVDLEAVVSLYANEPYVLWFDRTRREACILLKRGCSAPEQLRAWTQALLLARWTDDAIALGASQETAVKGNDTGETTLAETRRALETVRERFPAYADRLREAGWDLECAALETSSGFRAAVRDTQ